VPVAHTYNLSYSGGRYQEDHSSKPAWANNPWDPILKIPNTKKSWWSGASDTVPSLQVWIPEFKPQYHQKIKININFISINWFYMGFHCDIYIHAYNILWYHSFHFYYSFLTLSSSPSFSTVFSGFHYAIVIYIYIYKYICTKMI
jgi:hypothetical protein